MIVDAVRDLLGQATPEPNQAKSKPFLSDQGGSINDNCLEAVPKPGFKPHQPNCLA